MKKLVFLFVGFAFSTALMAQVAPSPLAEGVKFLNYEKIKQPLIFLRRLLTKTQQMVKPHSGMVKPC